MEGQILCAAPGTRHPKIVLKKFVIRIKFTRFTPTIVVYYYRDTILTKKHFIPMLAIPPLSKFLLPLT